MSKQIVLMRRAQGQGFGANPLTSLQLELPLSADMFPACGKLLRGRIDRAQSSCKNCIFAFAFGEPPCCRFSGRCCFAGWGCGSARERSLKKSRFCGPIRFASDATARFWMERSLTIATGSGAPGPSIVLGDRCYVGRGVEFNIRLKLTMGSDCLIAAGCRFIDHDHGTVISQGPMRLQNGASGEIILEDDVWLGANVIVLKGVTIGKGAVVAAASVVTKSIPSMEIWAGVPAKQIGTRR